MRPQVGFSPAIGRYFLLLAILNGICFINLFLTIHLRHDSEAQHRPAMSLKYDEKSVLTAKYKIISHLLLDTPISGLTTLTIVLPARRPLHTT